MGLEMGLSMPILRRPRVGMAEFCKFGRPRGDDVGFLGLVCRDLSAWCGGSLESWAGSSLRWKGRRGLVYGLTFLLKILGRFVIFAVTGKIQA